MKKVQTKLAATRRAGFTLLELLVVVAILAIIGGAALTALDGLDDQAAKATATHSIAGVEQTVRQFKTLEGRLPNNLETLMAATPGGAVYDPTVMDNVDTAIGTTPTKAAVLGDKLAGKFNILTLTDDQIANLKTALDAGQSLTPRLRFIDALGNDDTTADLTIKAADGTAATNVGAISQITIPQQAFDAPRPGDGRNRGRGYAVDISGITTGLQLMVWAPQDTTTPTAQYNNVKVGASPTAVLVGLGIGNYSDIVNNGEDSDLDAVGEVGFGHPPYYGNVGKNEYPNYILLVDVNQNPAKMVAVVDSRGDFLAEEFAESTGQKQ